MEKQWNQSHILFVGAPKSLQTVTTVMKLNKLPPWKKTYYQPRQHIKKQRYYLLTKVYLVKAMVFPVVIDGCESWTIKKAERQRVDAFKLRCWRRFLSPLDCKKIKAVHPKGVQS